MYGFADHAGAVPVRAAKPLWLLPLCLAVSAAEGEFAGAVFGAVCGLMWDYTAGRTVGMLALELMILCFGVSVVVQLYLKDTPSNFVLLAVTCALLVLSADWLFFLLYAGLCGRRGSVFLWVVLPSALMTAPGGAGCSTVQCSASARNSR